MNILGYLITWVNLQNIGGPGSHVKDTSVRIADVQSLAQHIRNNPEFPLEGFKKTGYSRVGNVGKYLTKNLRDYIYNGNVDPNEDGLILTLFFKNDPSGAMGDLSPMFIHRGEIDKDVADKINEQLEKLKNNIGNKKYIVY